MITLQLYKYRNHAQCHAITYSAIDSFMQVSCELRGGEIYGIISDFAAGSWGFASCICGRGGANYPQEGVVYLNGHLVTNADLFQRSCFISEKLIIGINELQPEMTIRECIDKGLKISNIPFSVEDIKRIFLLSDERFDRPCYNISGEIWLASLAIGFASGKDIFCYPWLNTNDICRLIPAENCLKFLKDHQKLVLIPTIHKKKLKKICDKFIFFENKGVFLKNNHYFAKKKNININ